MYRFCCATNYTGFLNLFQIYTDFSGNNEPMNNANSLLCILRAATVAAMLTTSAVRGDTATFPFDFVMDHSWDGMNAQHYPYFLTYLSTNSTPASYAQPGAGVKVGTNPFISHGIFVATGGTILPSRIKLNNCVTLDITGLSASMHGHFGYAPLTVSSPLLLDFPNMYGVSLGDFFITNSYVSQVTGQTTVNYKLTRSCNDDSGTNNMVYLRAASLYQDKALARLGCPGCAIPLPPMKQKSCTFSRIFSDTSGTSSGTNIVHDYGNLKPRTTASRSTSLVYACDQPPASFTVRLSKANIFIKETTEGTSSGTRMKTVLDDGVGKLDISITGLKGPEPVYKLSEKEFLVGFNSTLTAKDAGSVVYTDVLVVSYD